MKYIMQYYTAYTENDKTELYEFGLGSHQSFKRSTNIPTRVFCTNFLGKGQNDGEKELVSSYQVHYLTGIHV